MSVRIILRRLLENKVAIKFAGLVVLLCFASLSYAQEKISPEGLKYLEKEYYSIEKPEISFKEFVRLNAHVFTTGIRSKEAKTNTVTPLAVSDFCNKIATTWCDDFEAGLDQTQYTGAYGTSTAANLYPSPFTSVTYGFTSGALTSSTARHTIVLKSAGNDPTTGIPLVAANGGNQSFRLGNSATGAAFEMLGKTINITANNTLLSFSYAVVFQDPNHSFNEQPAFNVRAYDCATGLELPNVCNLGNSTNVVVSDAQNPFFQSAQSGSVAYRNWTQGQINLSAHIGKTVIIVFTNKDCSQSGHYGYTYLDNFSTSNCAVVPTDYFAVRNATTTSTCGIGQVCVDYKLPSVAATTGSVNISLDIYQNSSNTKVATFTSGVLTSGTSYCFNINPATIPGLNTSLSGFDYVISGAFALGSFSDNRTDNNTSVPNGYTAGANNDYAMSCIVGPPDVYYSKAAGDLHNVLTWGLNPDGSGPNPSDFNDSTFQLANRPGVYTMTGNWIVNGGLLNIPGGSQLQINGFSLSISDLGSTGTISGSLTSNLSAIGSSSNNLPLAFTAGANMLNNFTVNRTGTGAATIGNDLSVHNVLTLTTGTLNTGGFLTLKSTASNTARVAPVTGAISGDVTVERYIPMRRAWRILSAPVGGVTDAAIGQATLSHNQETVQGTFARPLSYGTSTFTLNAARTAMTFTATIFNIDVTGSQTPGDNSDNLTAAHIHVGAPPGVNAPVRWGFFGAPDNDINPKNTTLVPFASGVGGTFTGTWDLPEGNAGTTLTTNLPEILAGRSYINFHTVQFGGGEIRGQINLVGASTQTVNQAWQEGTILGQSANPNPFPGYGTHITGGPAPIGTVANGFDQNPVGAMSSIKEYIANTWAPLPNTNATPVGGRAYMTFVRGNRALPIGFNDVPPSNTTLRAKGPLYVGDKTFQVAPTGFTAIPNPFASPIDFATLTRTSVQNNFYLWDPKMGGANGVGAYVLLSFNGSTYDITPAPVSPESQYIQSGQGFLVRPEVVGTPGSITIKESDKSATVATDVFRTMGSQVTTAVFADPKSGEGLRIRLQTTDSKGNISLLDEVFASYKSGYSDKVDNLDAVKLDNVQENLGIVKEGQTLMVERKVLPKEADVISLKLWNTAPKSYILELNPVNLAATGLVATVEDKYLKTSTTVTLNETSQIPFIVTNDPASARMDRFLIILARKAPDAVTAVSDKSMITAYPNPISGRNINLAFANKPKGVYQVVLVNSAGQVVFRKNVQHAGGTATQTLQLDKKLVKGLYQLRVTDKESSTNLSISSN